MLTVKEYAEENSVSEWVVRNNIKNGNIKAKRIGRSWRIPVEDD